MKTVDVSLKKLDITRYVPQDDTVEYRLVLNDGADKQLVKQGRITDPEGMAAALLREARQKLHDRHRDADDDGPLAGVTIVRIRGDEEVLAERMSRFFGTVRERIRAAKQSRMSYLDMERSIVGFSTELGR